MLLRVVHEAGVEVRLICLIVVGIRNIVYSAVQTEQHTAHAQAPDVRYPRRHKLRAFRLVRELNWCRNLNFYFWKVRFYTNFLL